MPRAGELADRIAGVASGEKAPSAVVDTVLRAAVAARASDVHFEPVEAGLEIRFRLDGVLCSLAAVPPELASPVIARLKVLAGLATYRTEVPQDGRIAGEALSSPEGQVRVRAAPQTDAPPISPVTRNGARHAVPSSRLSRGSDRTWHADLRLSTYPTVRGEKAVVRLFTARAEDFRLDSLGLPRSVLEVLEEALAGREGLVVLTGPAGSGKTTTLYAAIQHIRDASGPRRHIVTIEDPSECLLPGITQTQTNPPAGLTFANCLRSMLRQDPEVIMIGEVRDAETASLALEAALTGHLVLTTLHAGTAGGVFARLLDMGVEPHFVTSVVRAALAQRLVRRLCPDCRRPEGQVSRGSDRTWRDEDTKAWEAPGCEGCLGTGFRGRVPLAEILTLTPELRRAVLARSDLAEIERAARASGPAPLAERGEELVREGETTEAEVARVLAGLRQ